MEKTIVFIAWLILACQTFAQGPGMDWQNTSSLLGQFTDLVKTSEGDLKVCGSGIGTWHDADGRLAVAEGNSGTILSDTSFGEYGISRNDLLTSIVAQGNGYYSCGKSYNPDYGCYNPWLIKSDAQGTVIWSRLYTYSEPHYFCQCLSTADGGLILSGIKQNKMWLVKTDSAGNFIWEHDYAQSDTCYEAWLTPRNGGGYVLLGDHLLTETGYQLYLVLATDNSGNYAWHQWYSFGENWGYWPKQILTVPQGYVLIGSTFGPSGSLAWIVGINNNGGIIWNNPYGQAGYVTRAYSAVVTDDGYTIAGSVSSTAESGNDSLDALLFHLNFWGEPQWQQTFNPGGNYNSFFGMALLPDSSYACVGHCLAGNIPWILRTNPDLAYPPPVVTIYPYQQGVRLAWQSTTTWPWYDIYTDTDPLGPFNTLFTSTPDTFLTIAGPLDDKRFYLVRGSN